MLVVPQYHLARLRDIAVPPHEPAKKDQSFGLILTPIFGCCYQSRHRRRFTAIQRVSVLDWEPRAPRVQHGLLLPQPTTLCALLRRERRALLALPWLVGHHATAPGAEPLPRHVPHGRAHAHRRRYDGTARAVRFRRTRVPLYALGVLVGRRRTVRIVLLGRRLRHVRSSSSSRYSYVYRDAGSPNSNTRSAI